MTRNSIRNFLRKSQFTGLGLALLLLPMTMLGAAFQFGGLRLDALTITSSSSATSLTKADKQVVILTGSSSGVFKLPDATTLQAGYFYLLSNESTGTLTVSNSSSTSLGTLATGDSAMLVLKSSATTGGPWNFQKHASSGGGGSLTLSYCRFDGANGWGSTNTVIRNYSSVSQTGTDLTCVNDSTNGASVTTSQNGIICGTVTDQFNNNTSDLGITINDAQLTTGIGSGAKSHTTVWTSDRSQSANVDKTTSMACYYFASGAVVRSHQASGLTTGSDTGHAKFYTLFIRN